MITRVALTCSIYPFLLLAPASTPAEPAPTAVGLLVRLETSSTAGAPGKELAVRGTLSNRSSQRLSLEGIRLSLEGRGLTADDSPFLAGVPDALAPGESTKPAVLFRVRIAKNARPGVFPGDLVVLGGKPGERRPLAKLGVRIRVANVPAGR